MQRGAVQWHLWRNDPDPRGTPQHNAFPINIRLDMDLRGTANLVRLRQEKGLSQEALAREAGVNRSYLALLETGQHYVGLKIIGKLAEALEVELAELLKLPIEEDA